MTPDEYDRAVAAATALATTIARAEGYADPQTAHGQCCIATDRLAETLDGLRIWTIRASGMNYHHREHWAALVPNFTVPEDRRYVEGVPVLQVAGDEAVFAGTIIDMTCRQFDAEAPVVFVGSLDDWLDNCCEWLVDGVQVEVWPSGLHIDGQRVWHDFHVREDIEPGPLVSPWDACV